MSDFNKNTPEKQKIDLKLKVKIKKEVGFATSLRVVMQWLF